MSEIEVTVLKYDSEYTKRTKDIKKNSWFSFPNDLLLHPDLFDISGNELKWFLWILSICSKKNQSKIRLNIAHGVHNIRCTEQELFSMIKKLQGKQVDVVCDQTATDGDGSRRVAASTLHNTTLHNTTEHYNTSHNSLKGSSVGSDLHPLINLWNEHCGNLAKVKKSNANRNKKIKSIFGQLTESEWIKVIQKMAQSNFCNGSSGWKADFDFFIKPETYLKVLEGKYDNNKGQSQTHVNRVYDQLDALEAGLNLGNGERDAN